MRMKRFMAAQLRQPHGWFGTLVVSRVMNRVNRKITEDTIALIDIEPEHDVLEIGFGGGVGLASVASRLKSGVVTGVDVSPDVLRKAERRFARQIEAGRVRVQSGDVCAMPFHDGAFDRVFTINTIYFWRDPAQGMSEIHRVLKQGGVAAVSLRSKEKMETHGVTKYGFTLFAAEDVAALMQRTGFQDVHVKHSDREHWYDQVIVIGRR